MLRLRLALGCVLLAALTGVAIAGILFLRALTETERAVPALISGELAQTRTDLMAEVRGTRADLVIQVAATRAEAADQVAKARQALVVELQATRADLGNHLSQIQRVADNQASNLRNDTRAELELFRLDLKPALDHAGSIAGQVDDAAPLYLDCEFNPDCAFNRFQGASKAVEQMAESWEKASPVIIAAAEQVGNTAEQIGVNSEKTTAASAQIAQHLEAETKPLPKWLRIVLAVAPPLAGVAAGAASTGAAVGAFH